MGHGASTAFPNHNGEDAHLFVGPELVPGGTRMSKDGVYRAQFIDYIKCGEWMDTIVRQAPLQAKSVNVMSQAEKLQAAKDGPLGVYKKAGASRGEVLSSPVGESLPTPNNSTAPLPAPLISTASWQDDGSYISLQDFCRFRQEELIAIMFSILLPMFEKSEHFSEPIVEKKSKFSEEDEDGDEDDDYAPGPLERQLTMSSRRVRDCLLSCAANFDEVLLLDRLQNFSWADTMQSTFDNYQLAISVVNFMEPDGPIVFANKAFFALMQHTPEEVVGKSLSVLNGPDTEPDLLELLQESERTGQPCKVAITHCTAAGVSFVDYMAVKVKGDFSFAVHCSTDSPTLMDDIKMVDDVLLLLSNVVRKPPLPKIDRGHSSWMPDGAAMVRALSSNFTATKSHP